MSVRSKTILIIFAYLIVLTASALAISRALLIDQFQDVDNNLIGDKLDQLAKIVDESQDQLASITKDYASQDDTVAYIQSLDPIFFQSNFLPVSLENLRIQLVVLMDRTGKVVNGLTLTGSSETSRLPEALQPFLLAYADPIIHQDIQSIAGFILLGDQLYQVSARPIHNSAGEGPAMGVLLLGRTAGAKEQERWQNWVKANLLILPLAQSSADFQKTAHTIPKNQRWWVETLDEQELAGYLMLYTPQKDISAVVKILTPRTVYQQGIQSLNIFWRVMILVGTVLLLGYLFVFDRLVMRPLQRLAGDLMGLSGEPTVAKRKEIGDILELRQPQETALEKVQKMQHETLAVSNTYRSIIEQAMEGFAIIRWDDLVILDANAAFSLLVDIPREELVGQLIETAIMLHGGIEDAQVFSTAAREQLKQGKPFQYKFDLNAHSGIKREIEINANRVTVEGQSLIYAIIRDVSELQYLQTELSWHLSESLLLNRVIASLAATLDKQVIFETICNEIADMLHIEHVTTSMFEPQNESLLIVAEAQHAKSPVFAGKRFLFSQKDPLRALLEQPTSYLIRNGQVEQEFKNLVDFFHPDPAGALLLVPLMFRNHVSGWLTLATQQPRLFQEREMNLVKNVTAAAGQALELTALYQDLQSELEHRRLVEKALAVREQYLEALVDILGLLLRSNQGHIEKSILATLGKVSSASQVSVYINHKDEQGRWFANELVNWTAGEGKDQHPVQKQEIDYEKMAPTWFDQMVRGGVITGKIDDLPPQEQAWLEESHVLSILVLPIFIGGDFFGFIRFDHCAEERQWDPSEISLLHAAAASISMAIERMQAENRMRESQSSLLLMLDQLPAVLWTTDLELNITSIRGSTLAGFAIQSPVTVAGLFPDRIYGENPVFMHYQALSGVPVSFEISNQDRYTQIVLEPFYDANGIIMGTLGLGLDVSERRKMMRELQDSADAIAANSIALAEARDQALEASRLKSEFLATMSHEIRTPMNAVIGMTELLLEQPMNAEQHQYTEVVRDSAQVLLALINDILDFSKIEAGKLELEEVAIDIPALVESVSELFAMKARLKGLHYEVRIAPNFPACLRGDPIRLRQILINLIGNAIKFTETGKIAVQVDRLSESAEAVSLQISVIDSGIGLNEIARRRLFQPFTQADGSTTRKFGGTGLGLAISKSLVELMGGSIGVESEEQRGSTFWFTVSLKRVPDELAASILYEKETNGLRVTTPLDIQPEFKSGAESGLAGSPAILLAEDNSANQLLAQVQIKKLGYAVDAVQNGEQVVAAVSSGKKKYALILMDCQMPVVDGFEATRLIRELEFKSEGHIPIIAMTANAMQGDRETCLTAGMDDYISKPVTMEALRKTLDYWLMRASYRPVDQNGEEAPAAEPVDDATLEGIRIALEGSDGDLLAEVVNLYLDESALLTDGMRQAIIDKDSTRLQRSAHNLKGSSANLGAGHLASLCLEMQGLAEANRFETAHIHLSPILAECDRVRAALKAKTQK